MVRQGFPQLIMERIAQINAIVMPAICPGAASLDG
jgi:hypothetical protein